MEQRQSATNENQIVRDFQTPFQRRKRFFDHSDRDGFYLETLDGGYKMPNKFCCIQETETLCNWLLLKRDGERFFAYLITIYNNGSLFFLQIISGNIWENYQTIERYTQNSEFLDVDNTQKELSDKFKSLFTNFSITI